MLQLIFMIILGIHDEPPSPDKSIGYIFTNIFNKLLNSLNGYADFPIYKVNDYYLSRFE